MQDQKQTLDMQDQKQVHDMQDQKQTLNSAGQEADTKQCRTKSGH